MTLYRTDAERRRRDEARATQSGQSGGGGDRKERAQDRIRGFTKRKGRSPKGISHMPNSMSIRTDRMRPPRHLKRMEAWGKGR